MAPKSSIIDDTSISCAILRSILIIAKFYRRFLSIELRYQVLSRFNAEKLLSLVQLVTGMANYI